MKGIESWKACTFIGILTAIAWGVNSYVGKPHYSIHTATPSAPSRAKSFEGATIDPAVARAQYLEKYLNSDIERKADMRFVAIVVASNDRKIERKLTQALASYLKTPGVEIVGSFFKLDFVSDGLLNEMFSEPTRLMGKLELKKSLNGFVLARQSVQYSTNTSLQNVITASMSLDVMAQGTRADSESEMWNLTASGAGFNKEAARVMAEERMLKQISSDNKMSLKAIFSSGQSQ